MAWMPTSSWSRGPYQNNFGLMAVAFGGAERKRPGLHGLAVVAALAVLTHDARIWIDGAELPRKQGRARVVLDFSVRDGGTQPAAARAVGETSRLSLGSWGARTALANLPRDDELHDLESPEFFALKTGNPEQP